MTFIASKLLWAAFKPSVMVLLLGLLGLLLVLLRRRRLGLTLTALSLLSYAAVLALPVHIWIARPLENRFPHPASLPPDVAGVIVLGGAIDLRLSESRNLPTLNDDAERMTAFMTLARELPDAKLAFTGGSGEIVGRSINEADVARRLFTELGLGDRPIIYENRSRNTYENALFLKPLAEPRSGQHWLLVTSALHMPRAVGCFRAVGWPVEAWPVAYKTPTGQDDYALDTSIPEKFDLIDSAVREWIGLLAYRFMDRSSALFPAP